MAIVESAYKILDYLPISFNSPEEERYISYLWKSFEANCERENYQFAFISYHMLYMCFVYFNIWQVRKYDEDSFKKALIFNRQNEKEILETKSPFAFSLINESAVFRLLKLIGCDNSDIGIYNKSVDFRNDAAHANGNIYFKDAELLEEKVEEINQCLEKIQGRTKEAIEKCFTFFLVENAELAPEDRSYEDVNQLLEYELVKEHYFSKEDINICLAFNIDTLSTEKSYQEVRLLAEALKEQYSEILGV